MDTQDISTNTLTDPAHSVQAFLKRNYDWESPLLLGYSGGPDSKALLYALLDCGVKKLHLAHVDHGWRETSAKEAESLRQEAKRLNCPFHTLRVSPSQKGNQENEAREERLRFFHSLFNQHPFQALLLAHQGGDLAETVLKRIFEGAHLPFLSSMEEAGAHEGMPIWRPLLSVKREEIISFLKEKQLEALSDPTNFDPAYLRARMRLELIPFLTQTFGKSIEKNLHLLSSRSTELKDYLDRKTALAFQKAKRGAGGFSVDAEGLEKIEIRHLILKLAHLEKIFLPRTLLEPLLKALEKPFSDCVLQSKSGRFLCKQGIFTFLRKEENS